MITRNGVLIPLKRVLARDRGDADRLAQASLSAASAAS